MTDQIIREPPHAAGNGGCHSTNPPANLLAIMSLLEGGLNRIRSFCWGFNSEGFTWPFVERDAPLCLDGLARTPTIGSHRKLLNILYPFI